MGWYALENIEDALQDSKEILLPVDFKVWTIFAIIILLTGYIGTGLPTIPFPDGDSSSSGQIDITSDTITSQLQNLNHQSEMVFDEASLFDRDVGDLSVVLSSGTLTVLTVVISLALAFLLLVTSVFEFVMFKSVKEAEPRLSYAKEYLAEGLQYFTFRLLILFIILASIVVGASIASINTAYIILILPVLLLLVLGFYALSWVAIHLALPTIIYQDQNFAQALSYSFQLIKENPRQVALFWIIKWVIGLTLGIIVSITLLSGLITLAIPFIITSLIMGIINPWLAAPILILFILIMLAALLYIAVPVRVYIYSYILNFYEDLV